nr:anaerobic sulfatase maturase [uncultured Tolumonas sp.]
MNSITNFQLMAKPSGAKCNIDCSYCFYLEKEKLYPNRKENWKMSQDTLEAYIKKNIEAQSADVVDFLWQGGEPTLLGLAFFEEAILLQQKYKKNKKINNFFQTNGINIDQKWVDFFKKNNFLVGISIDGNKEHNDTYRLSRSGKTTFDKVVAAIELLKTNQVEFNTLTVVNNANVEEPLGVYQFLKELGSQYIQFTPLVERIAQKPDASGLTLISPDFNGVSQVAEWSVSAEKYGLFLNKIFDYWAQHDIGSVYVVNFEQTMMKMVGENSSCIISEECGGNLIIESNGDIYSCDHFVYPENRIGNIHDEQSIFNIVNSEKNKAFGKNKSQNMSVDCNGCSVKPLCNGGCPKHRFLISTDGKPNKNYFCSAYKTHLHHSVPAMAFIIDALNKGVSLTVLRKKLQEGLQKLNAEN